MKNKFKFDNSKIFKYTNNIQKPLKELDKWSKLEINLQKNRSENYFVNDSISSLNIGSLKSMEWDDIKNIQEAKNDINFDTSLNSSYRGRNDINIKNLEKLINPIDDDFDKFIKKKIEDLEKLRYKNDKKIFLSTENKNNINDSIKNININNNNNLLIEGKNDEKSIIKEKNQPIFTFNKNEFENDEELDKVKMKSFLEDYTSNDINNTNSSNIIFNNYKKNESNIGNRNKMRLFNLLSRIKKDKKETELINKPNKFKMFDKSEENTSLNKIQRRYYNQIRKEDKYKDNNEYSKDYFSTIIYDLNKVK